METIKQRAKRLREFCRKQASQSKNEGIRIHSLEVKLTIPWSPEALKKPERLDRITQEEEEALQEEVNQLFKRTPLGASLSRVASTLKQILSNRLGAETLTRFEDYEFNLYRGEEPHEAVASVVYDGYQVWPKAN